MEKALINVNQRELWRIKNAAMDAYIDICKQVESGKMQFFRVNDCYFVTFAEEKELVICCCEGKSLAKNATAIYQAAKAAQYQTVRIHAFSKGIRRLLTAFNFVECETVYRLTL